MSIVERTIIKPGTTPTGHGICQKDENLVALSACCGVEIEFNWNEVYDFNCSKCKEEVSNPEEGGGWGAEYIPVDSTEVQIIDFVADWTGYDKKDINLEMGNI